MPQGMAEEHLTQAKSEVAPLWVGKAKLRVRIALPDESAFFSEAKNNGQPSDGLMWSILSNWTATRPTSNLSIRVPFPPTRT